MFLFPAIIPKEVSGQLRGGGGGGGRSWLRDIWGFLEAFLPKKWEFPERFLGHFPGFLCLGLKLTPPESCVI